MTVRGNSGNCGGVAAGALLLSHIVIVPGMLGFGISYESAFVTGGIAIALPGMSIDYLAAFLTYYFAAVFLNVWSFSGFSALVAVAVANTVIYVIILSLESALVTVGIAVVIVNVIGGSSESSADVAYIIATVIIRVFYSAYVRASVADGVTVIGINVSIISRTYESALVTV